jgi:hypothetical protein
MAPPSSTPKNQQADHIPDRRQLKIYDNLSMNHLKELSIGHRMVIGSLDGKDQHMLSQEYASANRKNTN